MEQKKRIQAEKSPEPARLVPQQVRGEDTLEQAHIVVVAGAGAIQDGSAARFAVDQRPFPDGHSRPSGDVDGTALRASEVFGSFFERHDYAAHFTFICSAPASTAFISVSLARWE